MVSRDTHYDGTGFSELPDPADEEPTRPCTHADLRQDAERWRMIQAAAHEAVGTLAPILQEIVVSQRKILKAIGSEDGVDIAERVDRIEKLCAARHGGCEITEWPHVSG